MLLHIKMQVENSRMSKSGFSLDKIVCLSIKFEQARRHQISMSSESIPRRIREIPEHFKTQEICNDTVAKFLYALRYFPHHLKTQEMCNQAARNNPAVFLIVPERFKTQELCVKALEVDS